MPLLLTAAGIHPPSFVSLKKKDVYGCGPEYGDSSLQYSQLHKQSCWFGATVAVAVMRHPAAAVAVLHAPVAAAPVAVLLATAAAAAVALPVF